MKLRARLTVDGMRRRLDRIGSELRDAARGAAAAALAREPAETRVRATGTEPAAFSDTGPAAFLPGMRARLRAAASTAAARALSRIKR